MNWAPCSAASWARCSCFWIINSLSPVQLAWTSAPRTVRGILASPHSGGSWSKGLRVHRGRRLGRERSAGADGGEGLVVRSCVPVLSPRHRAREEPDSGTVARSLEPPAEHGSERRRGHDPLGTAQIRLPGMRRPATAAGTREGRRETSETQTDGHTKRAPGPCLRRRAPVGSLHVFSAEDKTPRERVVAAAGRGRAARGSLRQRWNGVIIGSWRARCLHEPRQFGGWSRVATRISTLCSSAKNALAHGRPAALRHDQPGSGSGRRRL